MKIVLFGDVAAGKTTISNQIKQNFDFELVAIDDYRKIYGDFTMKGELLAQKQFVNAIKKDKNQIIESSGLGKLGIRLKELITELEENCLVIILNISPIEINKRLKNRKWDIPFPDKQKRLAIIVKTIHAEISNDVIQKNWIKNNKIVIVKLENTTIPHQTKVINTIENYIKKKRV